MSEYLSQKLKIISFFLMLLVVLLHDQMLSISSGANKTIQMIITQEITRIAVPLFFGISGFLFFINYREPAKVFFQRKLISRCRSILIPYLLTSLLGITTLYIMQLIPYTESFFTKERIENYTVIEIIRSIFWNPVGSYQLWFLKDLFILVLISPLIYLIVKRIKPFFILLFLYWIVIDKTYIIQLESLFFFFLGSNIAIKTPQFLEKKFSYKIRGVSLFSLWIISCITLVVYHSSLNPTLYRMFHNSNIIIGIIAIWFIYDLTYPKLPLRLIKSSIFSYSFFIYLGHEPLLTVLKKIFLFIGGNTSTTISITYILAPVITISICICVGYLLKTHTPLIYSIITGGRSK